MTAGWNTKILHFQGNGLVWSDPLVLVSISIKTQHDTTVCIITAEHVNSFHDPPAARYQAALIGKLPVR